MDIRKQRTLESLRAAYAILREAKPLEKITVTELTSLAKVNKATFYLHYSDIYALADEIENQLIDDILQQVSLPEQFFENRKEYTQRVINALISHSDLIGRTFSGSRITLAADKIEQRVKTLLYTRCPSLNCPENDTIISFIIQGAFHAIRCNSGINTEEYVQLLAVHTVQLLECGDPAASD